MIELGPGRIDEAVERLIPTDVPTRLRALAVVDGVLAGRAWCDDPADPAWVVVVEDLDGTVYPGGPVPPAILARILSTVETRSGEVVFVLGGPADPARGLLPAGPHRTAEGIVFDDRVPPAGEAALVAASVPDGLRLVELDAALLPRTDWSTETIHAFGSLDGWTRNGVGRCLMAGREIAAQAMAGPRCRGTLEMGVATRGPYRRHGYGTLVSRHVARACEAAGDRVWWNTSADNLPSQAIARSLGFRRERRYELVAYPRQR